MIPPTPKNQLELVSLPHISRIITALSFQLPLNLLLSHSQVKLLAPFDFISYTNLYESRKLFNLNIYNIKEPTYYTSSIIDPIWKQAISNELKSLNDTKTWDITTLPPNKRSIGCKWIFKLKFNHNGTIERYKVQLIAKGFNQTQGLDYLETFSHVIKMTTFRIFCPL